MFELRLVVVMAALLGPRIAMVVTAKDTPNTDTNLDDPCSCRMEMENTMYPVIESALNTYMIRLFYFRLASSKSARGRGKRSENTNGDGKEVLLGTNQAERRKRYCRRCGLYCTVRCGKCCQNHAISSFPAANHENLTAISISKRSPPETYPKKFCIKCGLVMTISCEECCETQTRSFGRHKRDGNTCPIDLSATALEEFKNKADFLRNQTRISNELSREEKISIVQDACASYMNFKDHVATIIMLIAGMCPNIQSSSTVLTTIT
ncbi:unnamed protein product [Meganyctiphanes norvegica]|uniref:Uncharacterized protein n=1 Tax=Meganyctiphanes norvegica TaxID=48144 RepID=A0AAV2RF63_MEGNR